MAPGFPPPPRRPSRPGVMLALTGVLGVLQSEMPRMRAGKSTGYALLRRVSHHAPCNVMIVSTARSYPPRAAY
jgi:hypothetical protein